MWKWLMGSVFNSFLSIGLIWVSFFTAVIIVAERIIQLSNQESKEIKVTGAKHDWENERSVASHVVGWVTKFY